MNKLEVLHQVKDNIQANGVIECEYIQINDGKKCFCAVGHVMNSVGIDTDKFLDEWSMENSSDVNKIYDILQPAYRIGFTHEELDRLQALNDYGISLPPDARAERVLEYIDTLIQESEGQN
jgi:hypothetical protein